MPSSNKLISLAVRSHGTFTHFASHLQSVALLALRLTWGWQLAESGYGHLTHIQKTVDAFKSWGVPLPELNVYISGTTELVGGSLLMLGLATRLISLPLVFNFIVAFATASRDTLTQMFSGPDRLDGYDKFINDSAFPMLMLALLMLAFGPGKFSLDQVISRFVKRSPDARGLEPSMPR
jgi:putative oxidoreductase